MDLCSITPVKQAKWMFEQPRVMLLTHLIGRGKYNENKRSFKNIRSQ